MLLKTRAGGLFLESCFSYAVYDFILDSKDLGKYKTLKRKYGANLDQLEQIGEEAFLYRTERTLTKNLLSKLVKKDTIGLMYDIDRYLIVFLKKNGRNIEG